MLLAYGNYRHAAHECEVVRRLTRTLSAAAQVLTVRREWTISGRLQAADAASLRTARRALEAAYAKQYQDAVLYSDDSGTVENDSLRNKGSFSGVLVDEGPTFPTGKGAEGGTFISYVCILSATYQFGSDGTGGNGSGGGGGGGGGQGPGRLAEWTETITITGGGPRYVVVEVVDGPPVRQLLNTQTKIRVVQQGHAKGLTRYPSPPGPLFPDAENPADRVLSQSTPETNGQAPTGFPISWTYVMEGGGIDGGAPNIWPGL